MIEGFRPLLNWLFIGGMQVVFLVLSFGAMFARDIVALALGAREEVWLFGTSGFQFFAALFSVALGTVIADWTGLGASRLLMIISASLHMAIVWGMYDDAKWEERMEEIAARHPGDDEVIDVEGAIIDRWANWAALVGTIAGLVTGLYLHWDVPIV